jgi:hypothetical protein
VQEGSLALNPNTGTEHFYLLTKRSNQSCIFSLTICASINIST